MSFLHCAADGSAKVLDADAALSDDVAVLPYEDGMKVVVRAALANGVKRCATVTVAGMAEGETRWIVNLAAAGKGAKVVSCVVKGRLEKAKSHEHVAAEMPIVGSASDGDGGSETPSELWVSGIKGVPSALPKGSIPFLTMMKVWYEAIECGDKRSETRKQCPKYHKWFIEQHPAAVRLQCGYTDRQMVWEVVGAEDCGEGGIEVSLGKRIV